MANKRFSFVIPAYNEGKNIPILMDRLAASITRDDIEIVLVNNGSSDETASILKTLAPKYPFITPCHVAQNQGYGFGILTGLEMAQGDFLGWTHADLQTSPADLQHAVELIESSENPDQAFIKGSRKGRSVFDNLFTIGMSLVESVLFMSGLWEINAQPNLFSRQFYTSWKQAPHDFSLDLYAYVTAKKAGLTIQRFPVIFPPREHGQSTWNDGLAAKIRFIKRTWAYSLTLRKTL